MIKGIEADRCYLDRSGRVRGPMRPSSIYPGCPWPVFTDGADHWIGRGVRMGMLDRPRRSQRLDPAELVGEVKQKGAAAPLVGQPPK